MKLIRIAIVAVLLAASMSACAVGPYQLNDMSRSRYFRDLAPVENPKDIPYETIDKDGIAVSYNLQFLKTNNFAGHRLTLSFRNKTDSHFTFVPIISLKDASGFIIQPQSPQSLMIQASALAGTSVPSIPASAGPTTLYHEGTVTSMNTGNRYSYTGTTTQGMPSGGFAGGLAQGIAQGAAQNIAVRAMHDRQEGFLVLRWVNAFWLKSAYELPPNTATSGALFFPTPSVGQLPLRLAVELGEKKFEFVTSAN